MVIVLAICQQGTRVVGNYCLLLKSWSDAGTVWLQKNGFAGLRTILSEQWSAEGKEISEW